MSLRTRLWLVLGALFLIPLVVGTLVIVAVVPQARSEQVDDDVRTAAVAVSAQIADQCRALGLAARTPAVEARVTSPALAVDVIVEGGYADYAALLAPDGSIVAQGGDKPAGSGPPADLPRCSTDAPPAPGVLSERVDVVSEVGPPTAVVTRTVNGRFARDVRTRAGSLGDVVLIADGSVVASTTSRPAAAGLAQAVEGRGGAVQTDGWTLWSVPPVPGVPYTVVVAVAEASDGPNAALIAAIMLTGGLVAGLLVLLVARGLSQPFTEVAEIAERVAQGDLDAAVDADDEGEAGRLGSAVNQMTVALRRNLSDLESSRADLRSSLERIGDALSSTHDLDRLLTVVLDTARATLAATAGVVVYRSADQLRLVAEQGFGGRDDDTDPTEFPVIVPGAGVLGRVVTSGSAVRGRLGSGTDLEPAGAEPSRGDVLAVPLRSMGGVVGVVALYDRADGRPFDAADEDALGTLVGQASIAVDNVQLHDEAQRLSTTDPLTGLWNFRYLSMSLAREIERSTRFERPLAVLMLDLDHFKAVNDTYGHHRGDTVLRELALRVHEQIREVDTFARYGGEEFVVVLPETTVEGAAQLAERMCAGVRREPFRYENEEPLTITVSVGGAAFPEHGSSPATLMRAADKALYMAKGEGRDRWHIAST